MYWHRGVLNNRSFLERCARSRDLALQAGRSRSAACPTVLASRRDSVVAGSFSVMKRRVLAIVSRRSVRRRSGDGAGAAVRHSRRPAVVVRQPRRCPGATVTVTSEALQGERTTVTDINGVYSFPGPASRLVRRHVRDGRHVDGRAHGGCAARRRGDDGSGPGGAAGQRSRGRQGRAAGAGELAGRRVQPARRAVLADADRRARRSASPSSRPA